MRNIREWFAEPGNRGYLYRVLVALVAAAIGYGFVTQEQAALWLGLGAAVLGTGTAAWNTPTSAQLRHHGGDPTRGADPRIMADPAPPAGRRRKFDRR